MLFVQGLSEHALAAFLLGLPSLFSIVNPVGSALIFSQVLADRTHAERVILARRVALYAMAVLLVSIWAGSLVLGFFGVSITALRIAGGLVVAHQAWVMLLAPEARQTRKKKQALDAADISDSAFFPLTIPVTTGPGTISVAVALSSARPADEFTGLIFIGGLTAAAVTIAATVWLTYCFADRVISLLGNAGARITMRLAAFLLLCIGVQILINGMLDFSKVFAHGLPGS